METVCVTSYSPTLRNSPTTTIIIISTFGRHLDAVQNEKYKQVKKMSFVFLLVPGEKRLFWVWHSLLTATISLVKKRKERVLKLQDLKLLAGLGMKSELSTHAHKLTPFTFFLKRLSISWGMADFCLFDITDTLKQFHTLKPSKLQQERDLVWR